MRPESNRHTTAQHLIYAPVPVGSIPATRNRLSGSREYPMAEQRRTVLITGAADGIGWAMAQRFAGGGDRIAIADLRLDAAKERAAELGQEHLAVAADVTAEPDVSRMVAEVSQRCGGLDVLINNAGIGDTQLPTTEQTVAAFDRLIGV